MEQVILHLDMDAFFASVEQLDNPDWRGKPVIVGSAESRGVVAAASYEARKFGIHSAMPGVTAKRLCPEAIFTRPHFKRYSEMSEMVIDILRSFTPIVDQVSIDEASCDLSGTQRLFGEPLSIAKNIQKEIQRKTGGLTGSVGMGPNRFIAKIASDMEKPAGLVWIPCNKVAQMLHPLPIRKVWGIGPKSEKLFIKLGIDTIGKLVACDHDFLESHFGQGTGHLRDLAAGEQIPLSIGHKRKSVSHETTFAIDIEDREEIERSIRLLSERVCQRLRANGLSGKTVSLKIRFGDFSTFTRSQSLSQYSALAEEVSPVAISLLQRIEKLKPVRLLGVGVSQLLDTPEKQLDLFAANRDKRQQAALAMDAINRKFGQTAVTKAGLKK